jgi:ribosome-associated protein
MDASRLVIEVTSTLALDESEIQISFVQSSGPGGQNVNKVATAAQLRFDVVHSPSLPEDVRQRLIRLAGKRVTAEGVLIIDARQYRTQERNRQDALDRLVAMIRKAAERPRRRHKTGPPPESRRRRLEGKRRRGQVKRLRRRVSRTEE